ncbi:MAG: hypothetical protein ACXAC7_02135 [Candidatus Hodarchaeales archaeon]
MNAQLQLTYKIKVGEIYEWKFTSLEGEIKKQEENKVFFEILEMWFSRREGDKIYDGINFYGLYLGEILAIKIESFPNTSVTETILSNSDFPTGTFETPRIKIEQLSISPNFGLPFFTPTDPIISDRYENASFNDRGILTKYQKSIRYNEKLLLATLDLMNDNSFIKGYEIVPIIPFIIITIAIRHKKRMRLD